jgi:hypothetical protein
MNLYGWDTVYAVDIDVANQALGSSLSQLIGHVSQSIAGALGNFTIEATFGAWAIALGGSNELLNLKLPITKGSVKPDGKPGIPLDGYTAEFQVALRLLPAGNQQQKLVFDLSRAGAVGDTPQPGVIVPMGFVGTGPDNSVAPIALNGLAKALAADAGKIAFAFATINLVPAGANSWLAPKNLVYAFFQGQKRAYLALLSTAGDPSKLSKVVDPQLVGTGAQSGYAFSLPLYYRNSLISALGATLPGNPTGSLAVSGDQPPRINLTSSISMNSMTVGAIDYSPSIDSYTAIPGVNQLTMNASGSCYLKGGCSMTWSASNGTANFVFDKNAQTIRFATGNGMTMSHSVSVPWYYLFGGLIAYGIAQTVAQIVGNNLSSSIGGGLSGGILSSAPPTSIQFAGMRPFKSDNAIFDGAVILIGQGGS